MAGEIVERVAKAICKSNMGYECYAKPFQRYGCEPEPCIKSCGCGRWTNNERAAYGAIAAMREPTMVMVDEAWEKAETGGMADVWRIMIDKAFDE